jgi:hypothetical protein
MNRVLQSVRPSHHQPVASLSRGLALFVSQNQLLAETGVTFALAATMTTKYTDIAYMLGRSLPVQSSCSCVGVRPPQLLPALLSYSNAETNGVRDTDGKLSDLSSVMEW